MNTSAVRHLQGRKVAALLGEWTGGTSASSKQLHWALRRLVLDGVLAPATRLPAERDLASSLGVSRTLVARALDLLREDDLVASRRGAGSWITAPAGGGGEGAVSGLFGPSGDGVLNMAQATPCAPPELDDALERARPRFAELYPGSGYEPRGLLLLRERLAERFTQRGLPTGPHQILVTSGAQHAFGLALRALVAPGERVLVEHPTYPNALEAIRGLRASAVGVSMVDGSWDLDAVDATLRQASPRLAYLIPDFQNPTGARLDQAGRQRLAAALRRNRTSAVVDETLVDLDLDSAVDETPPLPMAAFAEERVITLGSASKSFWGGLRIGWVRAPEDLLQRIATTRVAADLGTPVLEQVVFAELLTDADVVLGRRREKMRARRDRLVELLRQHCPEWRFRIPHGGLSLWCDLGAPVGGKLSVIAEQHGVHIGSGMHFAAHGNLERFLRLPYTLPSEQLEDGVARLARAREALDPGTPAVELPVT